MTFIFKRVLSYFNSYRDQDYWKNQVLRCDVPGRLKALQKLTCLSALENIIKHSTDPETIQLAKQRWANIVIQELDIDEFEAEQAVLNCSDEERLAYLVNQTDNSNVGILAFYGLRSESILLELMRKSNNSKLYPAIVSKLQTKSALEAALAHTVANNTEAKYLQLIEQKIGRLSAL